MKGKESYISVRKTINLITLWDSFPFIHRYEIFLSFSRILMIKRGKISYCYENSTHFSVCRDAWIFKKYMHIAFKVLSTCRFEYLSAYSRVTCWSSMFWFWCTGFQLHICQFHLWKSTLYLLVIRQWSLISPNMTFSLFTLLEAGLLVVNAIAILNEERFLNKSKFLKLFCLLSLMLILTHFYQSSWLGPWFDDDQCANVFAVCRDVRTAVAGRWYDAKDAIDEHDS